MIQKMLPTLFISLGFGTVLKTWFWNLNYLKILNLNRKFYFQLLNIDFCGTLVRLNSNKKLYKNKLNGYSYNISFCFILFFNFNNVWLPHIFLNFFLCYNATIEINKFFSFPSRVNRLLKTWYFGSECLKQNHR